MAGGRGQRNAAVDTKQCTYRRTSGNNRPDLKPTGEPDAVKVARPVRGRVVAKVPQGNSVATYPTPKSAAQFSHTCPLLKLRGSFGLVLPVRALFGLHNRSVRLSYLKGRITENVYSRDINSRASTI